MIEEKRRARGALPGYCCAVSILYSAAAAASAEKFSLSGSVRTSLHFPFEYIT